ncbi:MAG: cyclic nucleotide-binding domain-containing protein, partial [Holophagales bacterium]|nr:cyclic nucleotide-binding domain-containing protein [Holophagales bacterium]
TSELPADHVIFRQGDAGENFHLVRRGEVEIFDDEAGVPLATLGQGDFFGEMALISGEPRNATARTLRETQLYSLDTAHFQEAVARSQTFRDQLRHVLSVRS